MKTNTIEHYMSLPYTIVLKKDPEGDFVGRVDELQGCLAHGKDEAEALRRLKEMQEMWIQDALEAGESIPLPVKEEALPSGKWVIRVARSLHKELIAEAKREEISLNQLAGTVLAHYIGSKKAGRYYLDAAVGATTTYMGLSPHVGPRMIAESKHPDSMWNPYGECIFSGSHLASGIALTKQVAGIHRLLERPHEHSDSHDIKTEKAGYCTF